ncbi:MAG: hypothetical protein V4480_04580 [Patescibacteria group bacterium]
MVFPAPGLAEKIVAALAHGPIKTSDLIEKLQTERPSPSVPGIYKSIRTLREQKIVLVHKKEAVLNQSWLEQLQTFALLTEYAYRHPSNDSGHFLHMQEGDRITYEFKDPVQVDVFWNHVLYVLFDALTGLDRWYAYASHCWFLIARREEEFALQRYMAKRDIRYLFTVGSRTPLDRSIARDFDGVKAQYYMRDEPLFANRPNSKGLVINVIGDYVIEAHYDKAMTSRIETFYKENEILTPQKLAELHSIVSSSARIKFVIFKNAAKAKRLSKMFEKHFYFKRSAN